MKDKISALMDGELDDKSTAEMIDSLGRDGEALHAWRTYHLISDAMRDSRMLSDGFTGRVAARLSAEPALLAPARLQAEPRKWLVLSAAASVAAVSLVGWLAFAPQREASPPQAAQASATPLKKQPAIVPLPSGTNDYLLAHQGFSPRASLQGMAPYVRTVSDSAQESRVVKLDRRTAERDFPALLPERLNELARHYDISLGENRRIAGFDCQAVVLAPKDNLRYGYKLYADVHSGMLLKAVTLDSSGDTVEQFMFTQLLIGPVSREMVRPKQDARGWRIEDSAAAPARLAGWELSSELPGFHKVSELKRRLGESRPVGQLVYSDGLAAVSVFIEPLAGRRDPVRTGLSSMGAIHIYTRQVANHMVTVVGEAPAVSVQRIADSVEFRRPH